MSETSAERARRLLADALAAADGRDWETAAELTRAALEPLNTLAYDEDEETTK